MTFREQEQNVFNYWLIAETHLQIISINRAAESAGPRWRCPELPWTEHFTWLFGSFRLQTLRKDSN